MKNAIVGNLVKDFESATAGKAPQRIRVTMIIETLDDLDPFSNKRMNRSGKFFSLRDSLL